MNAACISVLIGLSCWSIAGVQARSLGTVAEHEAERELIVTAERAQELGGALVLTPLELTANVLLMDAKYAEVDCGFEDVTHFNPASHFFLRKKHIEETEVFAFIKAMPKGAALHVHDTALIGGEYLIKNITYRDNLYICVQDSTIKLLFAASTPQDADCSFQLLKDVRAASEDVEQFDSNLARHFTLETEDPASEYTDINEVWFKFGKIFGVVTPMLTYKPVWEDYFYEALRQFREDGILYVEFRSTLPELYDLNGNIYDSVECANIYKTVNDKFVRDHPDSLGSKLIYAPVRSVTPTVVSTYVNIAKEVKNQVGDFLAGFDLVGQEDMGKPLKEFTAELLKVPDDIQVFYHAGETNWFGTATDYNLIDAVLFGAKRLGHAFALTKHPAVGQIVKEKEIAIEVNPISNQVLKLVEDMRNHPGSVMLANDYPVVISSDDPGLWGALPLSHDMYEAFVGLASRHSDLRLLKQLALNSIKYSALSPGDRQLALRTFQLQWTAFIQNYIDSRMTVSIV
nr:adenosine deaminase 2-like [Limnephilus flavicornis]